MKKQNQKINRPKFLLTTLIFIVLIASSYTCDNNATDQSASTSKNSAELDSLLKKWSATFIQKIDKDFQTSVNFETADVGEAFHVVINNNQYQILEGIDKQADFTLTASIGHYNKIFRGERFQGLPQSPERICRIKHRWMLNLINR